MSLGFTAAAFTSTRTSPAPGGCFGTSDTLRASSEPVLSKRSARMRHGDQKVNQWQSYRWLWVLVCAVSAVSTFKSVLAAAVDDAGFCPVMTRPSSIAKLSQSEA